MKKLAGTLASALVLLVGALLMASLPAAADPLPAGVSDQLTIYEPDGTTVYAQLTLNEDGTLAYSGSLSTTVACVDGSGNDCSAGPEGVDNTYFFTDSSLGDNTVEPTVLCESSPCDYTTSNYSDIFGTRTYISASYPDAYLGFSSDTDTLSNPFGGHRAYTYQLETGEPISATQFLSSGLRDAGYTATFQSDGETTSVPEPGTLPLLATGLMGLALMGSLKRKTVGSTTA